MTHCLASTTNVKLIFIIKNKIKSLSIEINENYKIQHENIIKLMNNFKFKILQKKIVLRI